MQAEPEAFGSVSEAERIQKIRRFKLPSFNSKTSFLLSSLSERAPVKRFRKTLAAIDKEIQETQRQLIAAKARYDRLAAQLTGLNRQRKQREAEVLAEALAKSGKTLEDVLTYLRR